VARTCLQLAGLPFLVEAAGADVRLPEAYRPFLGTLEGHAAGILSIAPPDSEDFLPIRPDSVIWACPTWRMGGNADGALSIEIHTVPSGAWLPVANVGTDFSTATLSRRAGRRGTVSPFVLNYPTDQAILSNRLPWFDAFVVHACGIADGGGCILFCGRSGIGKTTMARLWRRNGGVLLNDDRVIVRLREGVVMASPTPWHGEEPEIHVLELPVRAICHLAQSAINRLAGLGPSDAAARLIATSVLPFYEQASMERALAAAVAVAERVPSFALDFAPDDHAVEFCRRELGTAFPPEPR
jgi:hypothetical protein